MHRKDWQHPRLFERRIQQTKTCFRYVENAPQSPIHLSRGYFIPSQNGGTRGAKEAPPRSERD